MKTLKFKSNINCTGCLSKVTPFMDKEVGIVKWDINLRHDDRILTVETDDQNAEEVIKVVKKAGFKAELLQ